MMTEKIKLSDVQELMRLNYKDDTGDIYQNSVVALKRILETIAKNKSRKIIFVSPMKPQDLLDLTKKARQEEKKRIKEELCGYIQNNFVTKIWSSIEIEQIIIEILD